MKPLTGILMVLMVFGCAKKEEPKQEPKPAPVVEKAPAPKAEAPAEPKEAKIVEVPITSKSDEALAAFRKGRDLAENLHRSQAIAELEKAVKLDPGFAQATVWLGTLKSDAAGVKLVEKAASLAKELPEAERVLIDLMVADKRGKMNELRGLSEKLALLAPTDWRAQQELGLNRWREFDLSGTTEAFRRASQLNPKQAQPYNYLAYSLAYQQKYDQALEAAGKFVELKPGEPNALNTLANIQLAAGNLDEAEKNYQKASESEGFYQGHKGVATVKFYRGDWKGGFKHLDQARKAASNPKDKTGIRWDYPLLRLAQGNLKAALKEIGALEKEAKKNKVDWVYAWASMDRALIGQFETRKYKQVNKHVDQALRRAKKAGLSGGQLRYLSRFGHLLRVMALSNLKKFPAAEKALAAFEEFAKPTPWDAWTSSVLNLARGTLALAKKDTQAAVEYMSKCIGEDLLCRIKLAEAHEQAGNKAAADEIRKQLKNQRRNSAYSVYLHAQLLKSCK